jgi:hypothetical protein
VPTTPDSVTSAAARLGVAVRHTRGGKAGDPVAVAAARRNLAEAQIAKAIEKALAVAPPLTADQRSRLARLLSGGASK